MAELSSMLSPWAPIVSSITALVAVIVGPLISLRIARRQTATTMAMAYRSIISPMRQKWIDGLRDRVSEFVSVPAWFYRKGVLTAGGEVEAMQSSAEWNAQSIKLVLLKNEIELTLNPGEQDHNDLLHLLERARQFACEQNRHSEFPTAANDANACCKKILKDEWKRVKEESLETIVG